VRGVSVHGITAMNAASTGEKIPQPRLVQAAREFEAQMMKELLKPMTSSGLLSDKEDAGSGEAMVSFASEALGKAVSAQGGFGIANRILADLSRSGTTPTTTRDIGNLRNDLSMRSHE
jgi:Rod binding domain-containing protein